MDLTGEDIEQDITNFQARVDGGNFIKMEITNEIIRTDIAGYRERKSQIEIKLAGLPDSFLSYQEHKKREQKRRQFEGETTHVKNLIKMAEAVL